MSQVKKLRTRLHRLKQTAVQQQIGLQKPSPASPEDEEKLAYLRGDGPQPPCPAWLDPSKWDSELRIEGCLMARFRGALEMDANLPNMTAEERREADETAKVISYYDWAPPWFKCRLGVGNNWNSMAESRT